MRRATTFIILSVCCVVCSFGFIHHTKLKVVSYYNESQCLNFDMKTMKNMFNGQSTDYNKSESQRDFFHNEIVNKVNSNEDILDLFTLWNSFPLTIMNNSMKISKECKKGYVKFLTGIKNNDFNAMKMLDATAKLPSGILYGNVNQYGNFDECMSADDGQYCLAEIDIQPFWNDSNTHLQKLIHSHYAIRETFNDPGHRIPGFTMIRWGFCVPKSCSNRDLEDAIKEILHVPARIRPPMCQKHKNEDWKLTPGLGDVLARTFFFLIITTVMVATLINAHKSSFFDNNKGKVFQILRSFSLYENWRKLTTVEDSNDIKAVHGIRALCALALLMSHKTMALFYNPYINRTSMAESLGQPWCSIGRTAILYTDGFMLVSGLLNANSLFTDLTKHKSMKFKNKLISRIFRISPSLIAVILFCTYILPYLGSGPLWPLVVNHHSELCKKYMWRNLLFIHNYFGFENMCLTHTHQVGIDMQLFIFTPIVVYLIWKKRTLGLIFMATLATLSTVLRAWITWNYDLSHVVHFGIPISRMFKTANLSYILPTHRATIYLLGVFLAYKLRLNKNYSIPKSISVFLWFICLGSGVLIVFGPYHMSKFDYQFRRIDSLIFGTLSPILCGIPIFWSIYSSNNNCGGIIGNFLCWDKFKYFTKISYSIYLVQFPVFFYNIGQTKHVGEYKPQQLMEIPETLVIILLSIALTLCIEMPFQKIGKILFAEGTGSRKRPRSLNCVKNK